MEEKQIYEKELKRIELQKKMICKQRGIEYQIEHNDKIYTFDKIGKYTIVMQRHSHQLELLGFEVIFLQSWELVILYKR